MSLPDPEALRSEYNEHYRQAVDRWSCHTPEAAREIVAVITRELDACGAGLRPGASVLDVGCAKGHICEGFRQAGLEAHGLDYSDVAVAAAQQLFPACHFHHMDGFNPHFDRRFDLIFMRGFSGCNTLDVDAVAALANKYVALLRPGGIFVLGYSTDFSGQHRADDTVCWSPAQIRALSSSIHAVAHHAVTLPRRTWWRSLKIKTGRLLGRRPKYYLYLFYQKSHAAGSDAATPARP